MRKIVERQTSIIYKDLNVSSSWYESFDLNFRPDMCILKEITYSGNIVDTKAVHGIKVPFIISKDNLLGTFSGVQSTFNSSSMFNINYGVDIMNGDVNFTVVDLADIIETNTADGDIAITLEFCKYEEEHKGGSIFPHQSPSDKVHSTKMTDAETLLPKPTKEETKKE